MIGTLTSWFKEEEKAPIQNEIVRNLKESDYSDQSQDKHSPNIIEDPSKSINIDEVSANAMNVAKDIGTYFYSFGKLAADQVTKSAKQLKVSIEENTLIGDFSKEQNKFVNLNQEKKKQSEVAVPPWVGYSHEEDIKLQILALSHDKRNVLRSPPDVGFTFNYENSYPVAMVMLEEDSRLNNLRFELVPKQIKENIFWRNYFYRVSLIKQSTEISTLTASLSSSTNEEIKGNDYVNCVDDGVGVEGIVDAEFASDAYITQDSTQDEDLHLAIQQLNPKTILNDEPNEDISTWESELQVELQEYEVIGEENNLDADLEQEILKQLSEDI